MATSSITKNFVISNTEQVEMFINAIEESAKNRPVRIPVAARQIKGEQELRKFMKEWEKEDDCKRTARIGSALKTDLKARQACSLL